MESVELWFGTVELKPYLWVKNDEGHFGQQYLRIDRDIDGNVVSRKVLPPACWIFFPEE